MLAGDVNLHLEKSDDVYTRDLLDILGDHDFFYHADRKTTHNKGGSLDVHCTKGFEYGLISVDDLQISDHFLITT